MISRGAESTVAENKPGGRLHHFIMADKAVRGAVVDGTTVVRAMRAAHGLGVLETLVLGHAGLGVLLLSAGLKGRDRMGLQIDCSGPIKGLTVEADAGGMVRGYLKQVPIPIDQPLESFNLSPFFGAGFVTVTRYLQDAKQPFAGKSVLRFGNIAQDLAYHFLTSEQLPTAFNLSVKFDSHGEVYGAGGLFLQAMPGADENLMAELDNCLTDFPSLGAYLGENGDPVALVQEKLNYFAPQLLATKRVAFRCSCNSERLRGILLGLPIAELDDILANGPFPVELRCHFCSQVYLFDRRDIEAIRAAHLSTH